MTNKTNQKNNGAGCTGEEQGGTPTNEPPASFAIKCEAINSRFREYFVFTNEATIKEYIVFFKNHPTPSLQTTQVLLNILKYNDAILDHHFNTKSMEWANWCDDVTLFVCGMYVASGGRRSIPIVDLDKHPDAKKVWAGTRGSHSSGKPGRV